MTDLDELHRVTWEQADDAYPPHYRDHVDYFVEGDERFVRRLVHNLANNPKVRNVTVKSSGVNWRDSHDRLVNVGPTDPYFNPV